MLFSLLVVLISPIAQGKQVGSIQKSEQIVNKEKSKKTSDKLIEKNKEDAGDTSSNYQMSLGLFTGYTLSGYHIITDELFFSKSDSPLAYLDLRHTFNLGVQAEIELLSWFSLQTTLYITQFSIAIDPFLVKGGITSQYFLLHFLFQVKFFWRFSNFKLSFAFGLGPSFTLTKPQLFGINREASNEIFMGSDAFGFEYTIHPQVSLFLTVSALLGGAPYGDSFFGSFYIFPSISVGVNRLFSF